MNDFNNFYIYNMLLFPIQTFYFLFFHQYFLKKPINWNGLLESGSGMVL